MTLWGVVAFLLGRGLFTTLAPAADQPARVEGGRPDEAIAATAERFARLYLEVRWGIGSASLG